MDQQELKLTSQVTQYCCGTIVDAQVKLVKSFEAVLELHDGTPGIVRNRELSWGPCPEHAGQILRKGQNIKVMVVGVDHSKNRLKLSLRQAERDPWSGIELRYTLGQVVRCRVTSLLSEVAIVELEPGIEGYIPLREICEPTPQRIDQVIWIGDTVDAVITSLKYRKRHVVVSMRKHLLQLANGSEMLNQRRFMKDSERMGAAIIELITAEDRQALLNFSKTQHKRNGEHLSRLEVVSHLKRILIADDDPSFRISLQSLLTRLGHTVRAVESAEEAVRICSDNEFDLVLIDMKFRGGRMNGLEAVESILLNNPHLPVLIVTGTTNIRSNNEVVARVRCAGARGIVHKPIALGSLAKHLQAIAAGRHCWESEPATIQSALSPFDSNLYSLNANLDLRKALTSELVDLQHATRATACILFKMDFEARVVRVLANTGASLAAYDASRHMLQASPVHEVVEQQIELFEEDISHNPDKFKYLNLIDYSSCIGLPVPTLTQTKHGIFLFHPDRSHFRLDDLREARITCRSVASILDREEAKQIVLKVQPFAFTGQVGSTLIHELNNRLGSVVNYAESLLMEHKTIENDLSAALDFRVQQRIKECVQNLHNNAKGMEEIATLYSGLVKVASREVVRLNEIVQRVNSILLPFAESNHVEIIPELEDELPATMAVGSWLEQIFINIALNAIQHVGLAKRGGELVIQTRFAQHDHPSLEVLFVDNGPGIHGQDLKHIFDLGFSTRSGGTGLGLFASRGLVESMGGTLVVTSSVMLVGTTFKVELPLVVPSMEEAA